MIYCKWRCLPASIIFQNESFRWKVTAGMKGNRFLQPIVIKQSWNVKRSCNKAFLICEMLCNVESNDFNCHQKTAVIGN